MAIAKVIKAKRFDTLCRMAVENGFKDCAKVRDANAGAEFVTTRELRPGDQVNIPEVTQKAETGQTEELHRFRRPGRPVAAIRFVHGSRLLDFKDDPTLKHIDVSNYKTDLAGKDRKKPFVDHNVRQFEEHADADPDTFKVEVLDLKTKNDDLQVEIDALRPVFGPDGKIIRHDFFPGDRKAGGTEAEKRSLDATASRQQNTKRFRTCYLRLVVDEFDKGLTGAGGRKLQTVLTSDVTEAAQAADKAGKGADAADMRKVEILDQEIRAKYTIDTCPAAEPKTKCQVVAQCPVGHSEKRVKATVHVLRKSRDGEGVVSVQDAEDWCRKYVRWLYAQANLSIKFIDPFVRLIQPPANMITIGTPRGDLAAGGGDIAVKIEIDGGGKKEARIKTKLNATPKETAEALAAEIKKQFPGAKVQASENSVNTGAPRGSADIIVGDPQTQVITIDLEADGDARQKVQVIRITSTLIEEFNATHRPWVGTPDERILLKNYDTGTDRIDVIIVGDLTDGSFGEAFRPNQEKASAGEKPKPPIINSLIVRSDPLTKDIVHTTLAHEMAHVLQDNNHITGENTEMSFNGSPVGDNEKVVHGPKRISDPADAIVELNWDGGFKTKGNPVKFLRENNSGLTTGW